MPPHSKLILPRDFTDAAKSGRDPAEIERLETVVRFAIVPKLAKNRRR